MRKSFLLRFGERKIKNKNFTAKKGMSMSKIIDNIVDSKLIKTKTNYKYLIKYLDEVKRPLVLVLPKMSGYFKARRRWK